MLFVNACQSDLFIFFYLYRKGRQWFSFEGRDSPRRPGLTWGAALGETAQESGGGSRGEEKKWSEVELIFLRSP